MLIKNLAFALFYAGLGLSVGALFACGGNEPPPNAPSATPEISAEDAKRLALEAVPGSAVQSTKKEDEKDEHRWIVDLQLSGSPIVVEIDRQGGRVAEITGEKAPFEYDFQPTGYLRFADARDKALAIKQGKVVEWELDLVKAEYEFAIAQPDAKTYEVIVDSKTGAMKAAAEKKPEKKDAK